MWSSSFSSYSIHSKLQEAKREGCRRHGIRDGRLRAERGFSRTARTVPLEEGFHRVGLAGYSGELAFGKTVRLAAGDSEHRRRIDFGAMSVGKLSRNRHVGTIVECEILGRSLVQFVDLRKTDVRFPTVKDVTVGVDTRIDFTVLGIETPWSVEIASNKERERKCAEDSRNSIHSSA